MKPNDEEEEELEVELPNETSYLNCGISKGTTAKEVHLTHQSSQILVLMSSPTEHLMNEITDWKPKAITFQRFLLGPLVPPSAANSIPTHN